MKFLVNFSSKEAKSFFLKGSSYFNGDFPEYISFEPILSDVAKLLGSKSFQDFQSAKPGEFDDVNYNFTSNKDGKFAWRPLELIHPVIYVSLVNLICDADNWVEITNRFAEFKSGPVECCSSPVISVDQQSNKATQVRNWWQAVEQQSLINSLEFTHILHTDVTDCYGSLYTHSIPWALHGLDVAKANKGVKSLGNQIDAHIQAGRYGQTNGISQGSVLMDFIAELVLGYVDKLIESKLGQADDVRILRYRDDYRIFANNDHRAEEILKVVSDCLRRVGMRLGGAKTSLSTNVVEGSIKPDKLAGIDLQSLGESNEKTMQKQLLRLHSFGRRFPNSGALRRLVGELHAKVIGQTKPPQDLDVQIAIATDIAVVSPSTIPAVAGLLSHLISLSPEDQKTAIWSKIVTKMKRVPYNGYLEIWLQRVGIPKEVGLEFLSDESICKIVNGKAAKIWENSWISSPALVAALDTSKIVVKNAREVPKIVTPEEVDLFTANAWSY